jgi:hypothetical protein
MVVKVATRHIQWLSINILDYHRVKGAVALFFSGYADTQSSRYLENEAYS